MDIHDSCSMTPPQSPAMQVLGPDQNEESPELHQPMDLDAVPSAPVCFVCQGTETGDGGNAKTLHPDSFLRTGTIDTLVRCSPSARLMQPASAVTPLYGAHFTPAVLHRDLDALFYMTRQEIYKLERMQEDFYAAPRLGMGAECLKVRQNVRSFFDYLCDYLLRYRVTSELLSRLVEHLKSLLLYLGRLTELPLQVLTAAPSRHGNQTGSMHHHLFHLHLEIRWAIAEVLHLASFKVAEEYIESFKLCQLQGEPEMMEMDTVSQSLLLLLWDLTILAINKHHQMALAEYSRTSPFMCSCVRELYVMVIHLLSHRQQKLARESFWVLITPVMQTVLDGPKDTSLEGSEERTIDSDVYLLPPEHKCKDPVGFCWWYLMNLAPLYQYDTHGLASAEMVHGASSSNYFFLPRLIKRSLPSNEAQLRCYLRCLLKIAELWEANSSILATWWDYFYKRMNDSFQVSGASMLGYSSILCTASSVHDRCVKLVEGDIDRIDHETSYQLFLRLVCIQLGKSSVTGAANPQWRQMKGRFYSKFHSRKVQELSDVGLQNLTCLFLVLANRGDLQDVAGKLCDLYGMLEPSSLETSRRSAVWRGTLALMLLCVSRGVNIAFLADKMVAAFNSVARKFSEPSLDSLHYADLWQLLSLYIEATEDVIETSKDLSLHEHKLIGEGFVDVLKTCRDNELRVLLSFLHNVLTKTRIVYKTTGHEVQHTGSTAKLGSELSDRLWQYAYPFIKQHSCTLTPPSQLADVAAGFCLLALDVQPSVPSGSSEDFTRCFSHFAWGESVNAQISCRFLGHMLPSNSVLEKLGQCLPDYETRLIQAWFRCTWLLPSNTDLLQELTRMICGLPCLLEIWSRTGSDPRTSGQHTAIHFIKVLGIYYEHLQDLRAKIEFRERVTQYFGDVSKSLGTILKTCSSSEMMNNVYHVAGNLVKYCANLIYLKSKPDCLLPLLVDRLALPRALLTPNKPVPAHMMSAIRENLYLFIQGLGRLDYKKDPYVQRKLKEMVTYYLTRFPVNTTSTMQASAIHPFVSALREGHGRSSKTADQQAFRQYFLGVVRYESSLVKPSPTGTSAANSARIACQQIIKLLGE